MLRMAVALLTSCSEQEYKLYDTKQTDAVFFDYKNANGDAADSVNYAFNYDIANTHTLELPVTLMGMPADHDRQITIKPVADSTDMVENVNYTIEGAIVPANSVKGTIKVNLLRDKDSEIKTKAKHLVLRIEDGNDLRCVGKNIFRIIYSDIRPTKRPSWWPKYSLNISTSVRPKPMRISIMRLLAGMAITSSRLGKVKARCLCTTRFSRCMY